MLRGSFAGILGVLCVYIIVYIGQSIASVFGIYVSIWSDYRGDGFLSLSIFAIALLTSVKIFLIIYNNSKYGGISKVAMLKLDIWIFALLFLSFVWLANLAVFGQGAALGRALGGLIFLACGYATYVASIRFYRSRIDKA